MVRGATGNRPYPVAVRRPRPVERALVFSVSASCAVIGYALGQDPSVVFFGPLWPWVFGAAALACLLLAVHFTPDTIAASGALTAFAFLSRAATVLLTLIDGRHVITYQRSVVGIVGWMLLAVFLTFTWLRVLRYRSDLPFDR